MKLVDHVERLRVSEPGWDEARSRRVLAGAVARRDAREMRGRLTRRLTGASAVAIAVAMIVLRATGAPSEPIARGEIAVLGDGDGDGGYAHD